MRKTLLITALIAGLIAGPAMALSVGPVNKVYTAGEMTSEIIVANNSVDPEKYQISVERARVVNGEAVYAPATEIIVAPRILTLDAGKTQIIRMKRTAPVQGEEVYRIRVKQLKNPDIKRFQILPTFDMRWIWRSEGMSPALTTKWDKDDLVVSNTGTGTARLVGLVAGTKKKEGVVGYVLPGETHRFKMPGFPHVPVSVQVNGQRMEYTPQ